MSADAPRYRLVALDIDGTLLRSDRRVSERVRRAVSAARAGGAEVVLVTGRRYPAARRVASEVGPDLTLVLHNGALVMASGVALASVPLPRRAAQAAVLAGRAEGADAVIHAGRAGEGRLLVEARAPLNDNLRGYLERAGGDVTRVGDVLAAVDDETLEVMFGGSCLAMERLAGRLAAALGEQARVERTVYPQLDVAILDVIARAAGKAAALQGLARRWGISREAVLAVGDNWNDREMLEWAGLGMVMGNAEPELRRLGLPVLPTNDQDGVAWALEHHVLAALETPGPACVDHGPAPQKTRG